MARKPNYNFERSERDRLKALKTAEKINARRSQREAAQPEASADGGAPKTET
jgi:hypothetical protein